MAEAGAGQGDVLAVTEFFKPGFAEIREVLSRGLAEWLNRRQGLQGWARPMELRSTTVWGHIRLRLLSALRRTRRASWRYAGEQAAIENWLTTITRAAALADPEGGVLAESLASD